MKKRSGARPSSSSPKDDPDRSTDDAFTTNGVLLSGDGKSKAGLRGDYLNVALLLFLYTLQGIPLGLSQSMDLILQEKKLSFAQQGVFSFVSWPYSLKILWAPIVDSVFVEAFGRRKSWLVPCQLLIGLLLVAVPGHLDYLLGEEEESTPQVYELTALFFVFYLLAATQDIALDGWAVTMLARRNIGYASTCNAVGQTFGFFVAFTGYLGMQMYGLCDLKSFMFFWGLVFLISTALVALLKHEETEQERQDKDSEEMSSLMHGDSERQQEETENGDIPVSVSEAYTQMGQVLGLASVKSLLMLLATRGIAFAAADSLAQRKLVQRGMKKEHLASLSAFITPLSIVLPGIISKQTSDKPLSLFKKAFLPRVAIGLLSLLLVLWAPDFENLPQGEVPLLFFAALTFVVVVHSILSTAMFVAIMAFFSQVSDPAIGGTYMTLLNTIANLGSKWPNQLVLFLVPFLDWSKCDANGDNCQVILDGFVPISIACIMFGFFWFKHFGPEFDSLEKLPTASWRISSGMTKK